MWIPKDEADIIRAVQAGDLEETATFDAKREFPAKNLDLAKDIAAMANDGGVIIIGIEEDSQRRLTQLHPIPLKGQRERIDQIVETTIGGALRVEVLSIPTANDSTLGYLVIAVPMSPHAPHMVGERFHGRRATGNQPLTQGEVDRLYARQRQWDRDLDKLIASLKDLAPRDLTKDDPYLYLGAWPVSGPGDLVSAAVGAQSNYQLLNECTKAANERGWRVHTGNGPGFRSTANWQPQPRGWIADVSNSRRRGSSPDPEDVLDIWVNYDGSVGFVGGGITHHRPDIPIPNFWFREEVVAEFIQRCIVFLGTLYQQVGYVGPIDLGLFISHLEGVTSSYNYGQLSHYPVFSDPNYQKPLARVPARGLLSDSSAIAQDLVMPLIRTLTRGHHNPFESQRK